MTLYRFELELDGGATHVLRAARHPSETEGRLVLRVLAWCLFAAPGLGFSRGVCVGDEPPLAIPATGAGDGRRRLWVELGLPAPETLERAARSAERAALVTDRPRAVLRERYAGRCARAETVEVVAVDPRALATLAERLKRRTRWRVTRANERLTVELGGEDVVVPIARFPLTAA